MFKIGDRVILKKSFFVSGNGTIVKAKQVWSDKEHPKLGVRYDNYEGYGSETDFHNIFLKSDPRGQTPSIEDFALILDTNDILKDLCSR